MLQMPWDEWIVQSDVAGPRGSATVPRTDAQSCPFCTERSRELPLRHHAAPEVGAPVVGHGPACLVCGEDHPSGLRLRFLAGPDASVATRLDLRDRAAATWPPGRCLDVVLHDALELVHLVLLRPGWTGSVRVERALHGRMSPVLTVDARPQARRGRTLVLAAEARDNGGEVVARARSHFVLDDAGECHC